MHPPRKLEKARSMKRERERERGGWVEDGGQDDGRAIVVLSLVNKAGALTLPGCLSEGESQDFRFILRHGSVNAVNRSIHPVENCVCLAERNTFAGGGRGGWCLCRGGGR